MRSLNIVSDVAPVKPFLLYLGSVLQVQRETFCVIYVCERQEQSFFAEASDVWDFFQKFAEGMGILSIQDSWEISEGVWEDAYHGSDKEELLKLNKCLQNHESLSVICELIEKLSGIRIIKCYYCKDLLGEKK